MKTHLWDLPGSVMMRYCAAKDSFSLRMPPSRVMPSMSKALEKAPAAKIRIEGTARKERTVGTHRAPW